MTDIYEKLARHLDHLPAGFPATESGVELRILRRLFSEEEAGIAMQ
ncbi:MAG: 4Fe-4S ferredoxin, partial [Deltaproteobacteria bacterium]